ncbi:MAG: hypothetical protein WDM89_07805 [Rhizomicrobium sp.]
MLKPVKHYKPTADDTNARNNAALNLIGLQGPDFPFHNVVAWNETYTNYNTCQGSDTDGNGIIMDSFSTGNGNTVEYTKPTLVAFNVSYNNGGGGVHIFFSSNVTAANNTVYNNYLDPYNVGAARAASTPTRAMPTPSSTISSSRFLRHPVQAAAPSVRYLMPSSTAP